MEKEGKSTRDKERIIQPYLLLSYPWKVPLILGKGGQRTWSCDLDVEKYVLYLTQYLLFKHRDVACLDLMGPVFIPFVDEKLHLLKPFLCISLVLNLEL